MKYLGSKNRIAKYIVPIMLEEFYKKGLKIWFEPFVGGGNVIDKIPSDIHRVGSDINPHTIEALIGVRDLVDSLPLEVSEEYYKSLKGSAPNPITSLIRFSASFGGRFENGFARGKKVNGDKRDCWKEAIRNAQKQSPNLQGVVLQQGSYRDFSYMENALIYCDIPYKNTTKYKTQGFDYEDFYTWCQEMKDKGNYIFVSEYEMPPQFNCVWERELKTNFASNRKNATHVVKEKLFSL